MSLSPENYEKAIAVVEVTREESPAAYGSVLVYRDGTLLGEKPSGCDGWPLIIRDGFVYTNLPEKHIFFPPFIDNYDSGSMKASKLLHDQIREALKKFHLEEEMKAKGLEPVTAENYVSNVLRTESCDMEPIKFRLDSQLLGVLADAMQDVIKAAQTIDMCKKHIFYGRHYDELEELKARAREPHPHECHRVQAPEIIRMLHAAIGMTTEAGELTEMLYNHIFHNEQFDRVNAAEEIGDTLWYIGVGMDVLDVKFQGILQTNIDKLRARYPDKFREKDANERDLEKEHEILRGPVFKEEIGKTIINQAAVATADIEVKEFDETTKKELLQNGFGELPEDLPPNPRVDKVDSGVRTYVSTPKEEDNVFFISIEALKRDMVLKDAVFTNIDEAPIFPVTPEICDRQVDTLTPCLVFDKVDPNHVIRIGQDEYHDAPRFRVMFSKKNNRTEPLRDDEYTICSLHFKGVAEGCDMPVERAADVHLKKTEGVTVETALEYRKAIAESLLASMQYEVEKKNK